MKTRITLVHARRIWDSRGRPTVEVDVTLQDGSKGTGMAPAGASRGSREALEYAMEENCSMAWMSLKQCLKSTMSLPRVWLAWTPWTNPKQTT